jgi:tyrosine-protein phosphatase YwqE
LLSSKPKLTPADLGWDLHSHLIPGVDDGVEDEEEAISCMEALRALGYRGAVTTPHIRPGMFENEEGDLRGRLERMRAVAAEHVPDFGLALAAEYWFDDQLMRRIEEGPEGLLGFGPQGRLLLVEFPSASAPFGLDRFVEASRASGFQPIIAHPERYAFLRGRDGRKRLAGWRAEGALAQINVGALGGQFGPGTKAAARGFHKHGLVDLIGTDMHRARQSKALERGWRWFGRHPGAFDTAQQFALTAAP